MSKKCCVCGDSKETAENVLFTCQNHGCDVIVHQACYGIVTPPSGLWFCRKCESQERAARVRCELCPKKEGALKRTDSGGWAHVVCALYIPEATFGNNERMEPIVTSKLPKERFSKPCYICEERGLETQAIHGACMSCHKSSCRLAFHVTCAQKEHLLCEEEDSRDPRNLLYCGYCSPHFKKMARQKYKQSLRKPLANTPTTATPPFPSPLSPHSPPSHDTPLLITPHPYTLPTLTPSHVEPISAEQREETHMLPPGRVKKEKLSLSDHSPHHKRPSIDSPLPPTKRKRRRKVSSSNESTTSETLSFVSDPQGLHTHSREVVPENSVIGSEAMDLGKDVGGGSREVHGMPFSPVTHAQVVSAVDTVGGIRAASSSTSSEQSLISRSQTAPPRSLQDLLERQWEQTAQFILDKVGKQNNVGSMLAHLHTLQSENRQMQSQIMELASQREFYIAINTKLRQTITEQDVNNRLPNGVRDDPQLGSPEIPVDSPQTGKHRSGKRNGGAKNRSRIETTEHSSHHSVPSGLSKEAQDSFLKAHFSNQAASSGLFSETSQESIPYNQRAPPKCTANYTHHNPIHTSHESTHRRNSNTHRGSGRRGFQTRGPPTCMADPVTESAHEITRVTNSVQAPITAFVPLPRDAEQVVDTGFVERGGALIRGGDSGNGSVYDNQHVR